MAGLLELHELVGYIAGALVTISFLPQVIKMLRERSAKDISLGMYALFCAGIAIWLIYGILTSAWPVIFANALTLILSGTVLILKIRNG